MQTAHCLFHIDIEQVGEREGHCQQRLPSLPMSHLLALVVDTVAYKYLSFIGLRAFASSGLGASGSAHLTFQNPAHAAVQSEPVSSFKACCSYSK